MDARHQEYWDQRRLLQPLTGSKKPQLNNCTEAVVRSRPRRLYALVRYIHSSVSTPDSEFRDNEGRSDLRWMTAGAEAAFSIDNLMRDPCSVRDG
jgi:hypothetical protein